MNEEIENGLKETPLLQVEGLVLNYLEKDSEIPVLRGLDLNVFPGEKVAIMGPSGSGKSTLLNILGLLLPPTAGRYAFRGGDVLQLTRTEQAHFRRSQVGFIFQSCDLLEGSTVRENLEYPLVYADVPRHERVQRISESLNVVGLSHLLNHAASHLSGGEKQRVAVARALVNRPRVILADEPTGQLDRDNTERMMEYFNEIVNEGGVSLVVATHNGLVAKRCDRICRLRDGLLRPDDQG
ncbi:MAG: ABC transporter ATP-binding protein [Deltaproteobacteria bacterium]|nr:ABC transporter ATP-binding protein [Deltaproteobacteria bacterium]